MIYSFAVADKFLMIALFHSNGLRSNLLFREQEAISATLGYGLGSKTRTL